jgi:hypothetical protein
VSYTFPKGVDDGHEVTLVTGVVYVYSELKNRWDVKEVASDEHGHDDYATDSELNDLAERVEHLETTVADHRFIVDTGVPSDGVLAPLSPDGEDTLWENVTGLSVAKVDADGRAVSMEQVYPGIAIRLVEYGNSGHFVGTVDSVTDEGTHTLLDVTASHGAGTYVPDDEVVMSVFPPGGESDLSLYVTQDQLTAGLSGKAPSSHSHSYASSNHSHSYASSGHSHSYASSGHGHSSYAIKGSSKKIMQDDGSTGPVQFTTSGNNLYWTK